MDIWTPSEGAKLLRVTWEPEPGVAKWACLRNLLPSSSGWDFLGRQKPQTSQGPWLSPGMLPGPSPVCSPLSLQPGHLVSWETLKGWKMATCPAALGPVVWSITHLSSCTTRPRKTEAALGGRKQEMLEKGKKSGEPKFELDSDWDNDTRIWIKNYRIRQSIPD